MAPKSLLTPALIALNKTRITTSTSTPVFVRHLQQNTKKNNAAHIATTSTSDSPTMGRAGYDTTNMKVATRPRLAGKGAGKSDTDGAKHPSSSVSQHQQRGEGVGGTSDGALAKAQASEKIATAEFHYKIPTGREVEGHNPVDDDLPVPPLVGRGWTFWL